MHVTVRHYAGNTELVDALAARESDVKELISTIDGFRAYYLVRTSSDDALTVSVYDSAAGGDQSVKVARDWIVENLPDMEVSPPEVTAGDVALTF
jgi:hypothetical protein